MFTQNSFKQRRYTFIHKSNPQGTNILKHFLFTQWLELQPLAGQIFNLMAFFPYAALYRGKQVYVQVSLDSVTEGFLIQLQGITSNSLMTHKPFNSYDYNLN